METLNNNKEMRSIDNLEALGLPADSKRLRVLWMYPDTLSIHGGRGDMMALQRFSAKAGIPLEIRRVETLADKVPFDEADMLYFCCGDLNCTPDVIKALEPVKVEIEKFAAEGKVIIANGSSGAVLSEDITMLDGTVVKGLGLLKMHWTQRETVIGNDLWLETVDGVEVIGNEIKLADISLEPGQSAFAEARYGYGNKGDKKEGAIKGNVIYTSCLGPLLVRNPALAMNFLKRASLVAGMDIPEEKFTLPSDFIVHELECLRESKKIINVKLQNNK